MKSYFIITYKDSTPLEIKLYHDVSVVFKEMELLLLDKVKFSIYEGRVVMDVS